jgi:hypothetical protein
VFLMIAILTGVRWNFNVLICISFIAKDAEHFFMCLLAVYTSSLEDCLFSSSAIYSVSCWFFASLVFWALFIFWLSTLCQMYSWQRFPPIL